MGIGTECLEAFDQDGGGGDAVDVEVAVHGDKLAAGNGPAQPRKRGPNVRQEHWIVLDWRSFHERGCLFGRSDTPVPEEVSDERREGSGAQGAVRLPQTSAQAPASARRVKTRNLGLGSDHVESCAYCARC